MRLKFRSFLAALVLLRAATAAPDHFQFVILGDRTGAAQPGVYEQALREAAGENPAFVVSVGDTIEGMNDAIAEAEWRTVERILAPYRRCPIYFAPGNHDIWSDLSEKLFQKYAKRPTHYSFDHGPAHFTILDNSRSDEFSQYELKFLEKDLETHASQPVKFVVSHRPSWLIGAFLGNPSFPLHQLAKKYGVQYVIAGHVHEMLRVTLDGVMYVSMASSGGHLRASKRYEDGWFFAYALAKVNGNDVQIEIRELKPPHGKGRVTRPGQWGRAGLIAQSNGRVLAGNSNESRAITPAP